MKKIIGYILVGVVSAGTTFGLIEYTQDDNFISNVTDLQEDPVKEEGSQFATYNYASGGTAMPDFTKAASESVNAVVSINSFGTSQQAASNNPFDMFEEFFGRPRTQTQPNRQDMPTGTGSGVIISEDGYIITNNHVIKGASKLDVILNNKDSYTATVIGSDPNTDIALLKIDEDHLPFLTFYNSDNIQVGEWVLAVGNPFGLSSTVTAGIVSAKGRGIGILQTRDNYPIESFIQTDAAINPGNSGGALVNTNGHLVGINTAIFSKTGSYAGYGFAVPSNIAKKVVDDIRSYGLVQRGFIGIEGMDLSNKSEVNRYNQEYNQKVTANKGVMVFNTKENSGAEQAGIKRGDIIRTVDGKPISTFAALSAIVGSKNPGDKVRVEVLRDGDTKMFTVILQDINGNTNIRTLDDLTPIEKLGINVQELSEEQKTQYGIDHGAIVSSIKSNSQMSEIGIKEGYIILEVNDKPVDSEDDLNKILKKSKDKVSVSFVDRYGRLYTRGFSNE